MSLLDEIRALPAQLLAERDTAKIAEALNVGRVRPVEVPAYTVRGAIYALGMMPAFLERANAARAGVDSSPVACACQALYDLSLAGQPIPMNNPAIAARVIADLDLMVGAGVLTEEAKAVILSLVNEPDPVDEIDVRRACWSDLGDWLP